MIDKNDYKSAKFNNYLNKIISYSSKDYYEKQIKTEIREKLILDDENSSEIKVLFDLYDAGRPFDKTQELLELKDAMQKLSDIEQTVLFLLFHEDLEPIEASEILKICSKSVSRIKCRALDRLKKYYKGGSIYEK